MAQKMGVYGPLKDRTRMYIWGRRSLNNLKGVHRDLRTLADYALSVTDVDMSCIEGLRSVARQRRLVAEGKSRTMNSRHLTGHAVDMAAWVNGTVNWDWKYYYPIADAFIEAAKAADIPLRWGGNWRIDDIREWDGSGYDLVQAYPGNFYDLVHWELPRNFYQ